MAYDCVNLASLLEIRHLNFTNIQCVGKNLLGSNVCCTRSVGFGIIGGTISTEVRNLLHTKSMQHPAVDLKVLYGLAELCLCERHSPQSTEVVDKWWAVLGTWSSASAPIVYTQPNTYTPPRFYTAPVVYPTPIAHPVPSVYTQPDPRFPPSPFIGPVVYPAQSVNTNPNVDGAFADNLREQLKLWKEKNKALDQKAKEANNSSRKRVIGLENKVSATEDALRESQVECSAQKTSNSKLRTAKSELKSQLVRANTQLQALQEDKSKTDDHLRFLQAEIDRLRIGFEKSEESGQLQAAELVTKDQDLRHEEARVEILFEIVSRLEVSEANLRRHITGCWLHGIRTWFKDNIGIVDA